MLADLIDRTVFAISPAWGAKRIATRKAFAVAEKRAAKLSAYEASGDDRTRGHKWLTSGLSADSEFELDANELRERSVDLYRKDAYATSAVNTRVINVIGGSGIKVQAQVAEIGIDAETVRTVNGELDTLWRIWSEPVNLARLQRRVEKHCGLYGEAFVVWGDEGADGPVSLTLRVISPMRCETPAGKTENKNIRLGIETDADGKRVAYYFRRNEPGDTKNQEDTHDRIPAERVWHVFEADLPGQSRGWPWLATAMPRLKDVHDFVEAHLISEQVAACFSAFIETEGNPFDETLKAASGVDAKANRLEDLEPGIIQRLNANEKITFSNPNRTGGTLGPFMELHLRAIAAATSLPYELLAKDYSKTTYSSGRLSLIDGRLTFRLWQQIQIDSWLRPLWQLFAKRCAAAGLLSVSAIDVAANEWVYTSASFTPPGWSWIDPTKEVTSSLDAINGNIGTMTDILAGQGKDLDGVLATRKAELIALAEMEAAVNKHRAGLGLAPLVAADAKPVPIQPVPGADGWPVDPTEVPQ